MKKRGLAVALSTAMVVSMAGCGSNATTETTAAADTTAAAQRQQQELARGRNSPEVLLVCRDRSEVIFDSQRRRDYSS